MELTRVKKDAVNDNDNLSQQMKYARLLGEMRPRRDPGVRQHEEAHQTPPVRASISCAVIERHIILGYPKFNGGLHILVMWHEYVLCSKYGEVLAESNLALISQFIDVVPKTTTLFDERLSSASSFSK